MMAASGRGSSSDLWRLQSLAASSLVISATRKCPLRCGHCITRSSPDAESAILSSAQAGVWAQELAGMAASGLRHLTLTGGEPMLSPDALGLLVRAARTAGIAAFVVTSGAWATTPEVARRLVARAGPVSRWDLGVDGWHAAQMPLARVDHALSAIAEAGGEAVVRVCEAEDPSETRQVLDEVEAVVAGRAQILCQSVRALGRADALTRPGAQGLPRRSCVSTGLFVRADGSTGPCCAGLAYEVPDAPFAYGDARQPGALAAAWGAWKDDQLLGVMRLSSLAALEGWLPDRLRGRAFADDPCEACVSLWSVVGPNEAAAIRARSKAPLVAEKLEALEAHLREAASRAAHATVGPV